MSALVDQSCEACRGGVPALSLSEMQPLLAQLDGWRIVELHHLSKDYAFDDFVQGLDFVNVAGAVAERQGHHPDLHLSWGRVRVDIWTHKIDGLSESDFVLAAKLDEALRLHQQLNADGEEAGCGDGAGCG